MSILGWQERSAELRSFFIGGIEAIDRLTVLRAIVLLNIFIDWGFYRYDY